MKKIMMIIAALTAATCASAFDWKASNDRKLHAGMRRYAQEFALQMKGTEVEPILEEWLRRDARAQRYEWINLTHEVVRTLLEAYPPVEDSMEREPSFDAKVRRGALRLLDYPLHFDNFNRRLDSRIFDEAVARYEAGARSGALEFLGRKAPHKGELSIYLVYNMGYIMRTCGATVGIDIRWNGTHEEAARMADAMDVLFLTHPHSDHYCPALLQAMINAGKPVVLPCRLPDFDTDSPLAMVVDTNILAPVVIGGVKVLSFRGDQGENIPNNVYLLSFNGWTIAHQGDNADLSADDRLAEYPAADVIISPSWNGFQRFQKVARSARGAERKHQVYLPSHNNELEHTVDHRESFMELFSRQDRLGSPDFDYMPFFLQDIGETITLRQLVLRRRSETGGIREQAGVPEE